MDLFGSSGARGALSDGFDPGLVRQIAQAATTYWGANRVAIGRDVRVTGPAFVAAATAGATAAGATVHRLGEAPTPAIQSHADRQDMPAIAVTASHNPPPDNGVKLIDSTGAEVTIADYEAIEGMLARDSLETARWAEFGTIETVDGVNRRYVSDVLEAVDAESIRAAELTVVIDTGNGAGGHTSPQLCRQLGCRVHTLNAQPDGHFPGRQSEPVPAVLDELATMVEAVGADLGVAHDGDADRVVFVNADGEVIDGGAVLAALAASVATPDDVIVSAVSASTRLREAAARADAEVDLTRVGAAHVLSRVRELREAGRSVAIAGEQNGGIAFPRYRLARDGAYTLARMLALVAERPIADVVAPYTDVVYIREDVHYENPSHREAMLDRAREWARERTATVSTVDGVRVDDDDSWVLVRASGTEPLIRIYVEAPDRDRADTLLQEALEATVV